MSYIIPENELYHFGIKGQKWGIRRFQNEDGSYTQAGKKRYGIGSDGSFTSRKKALKYFKESGKGQEIAYKQQKYMSDYAQQNSKKSTQEIKDAYKRHEERLKNNIDRETSRKQYVSDFNKIMSTGVSNAAKYSVNKLLDEYGSMTMTAFVDSATNIPSLTKYNGHRDSINYGRNLVNDYMVYSVLNTTRIGG